MFQSQPKKPIHDSAFRKREHRLDELLRDSFPASDPPSYGGSSATPGFIFPTRYGATGGPHPAETPEPSERT